MINLKYYKGVDLYSDGDVEQDLLEIFQKGQDPEEIIQKDHRWPVLYHLSPQREYLLEWFPFKKEQNLLEIGSGCGALTGLFCERLNNVTAVELSKKRSEINDARNSKHNNLEIMVGNISDVVIEDKFDYVTLIGVLEYAKSFIDSNEPYVELFKKIKKWLKPKGKLIIAIENKFGLKYWTGAKEDHTGKLFEGLQGYPGNNKVETFGKKELSDLLTNNDFSKLEFYYPYPDYKLPDAIYSDNFLPDLDDILKPANNYDSERFVLMDEASVISGLLKNKIFDNFCNSFLVFAEMDIK
jgi:SAM-dependent methyltransferase